MGRIWFKFRLWYFSLIIYETKPVHLVLNFKYAKLIWKLIIKRKHNPIVIINVSPYIMCLLTKLLYSTAGLTLLKFLGPRKRTNENLIQWPANDFIHHVFRANILLLFFGLKNCIVSLIVMQGISFCYNNILLQHMIMMDMSLYYSLWVDPYGSSHVQCAIAW